MSTIEKQDVDMVSIEVDGVPMEVPKNSMIIEATDKAGIDVPRFCYHKKLSIAANCRMCLVDVEKAPKPLPACATPVMDGMKVYTQSRRAIDAQHAVMEFLLINHPLDCPICDQGGECELQDLAMGYGRSVSRFTERKRVVKDKNVGPLIHTDMTRCIHCTRCVRFLEEIAGTSEMGGTGRGDRMEIGTCIERSIDSELSGNIIDVCPVGALTNKPFRYSARAWELQARRSVAIHDGVGSQLHYHVRGGRIMRAVPAESESTNETWLSDRDRYSHFGLYSDDRATSPRLKRDGQWAEVGWDEALAAVRAALSEDQDDSGREGVGILMSPSRPSEEYFLARRLADGIGSVDVDVRMREQDFRDDTHRAGLAAFESRIAGIENSDALLIIGSNVRHEAPIIGHRVRKAWRAGARIAAINLVDWNDHFEASPRLVCAPQELAKELAGLARAVASRTEEAIPAELDSAMPKSKASDAYDAVAAMLAEGERAAILVGHGGMDHPEAALVRQLARWIASATGAALNLIPHGGNATGAQRYGALAQGANVRAMLEDHRRVYVLWDIEPDFDIANPSLAARALEAADTVIAVTSFATSHLEDVADIILPLNAVAESDGSVVNLDGDARAFRAAAPPPGQCRPGWKILRRLGSELKLDGFDAVQLDDVQREMESASSPECPQGYPKLKAAKPAKGLYRIGEVPMYSEDALLRRAQALQKTAHADSAFVALSPDAAASLGLEDGETARVSQGDGEARLPVRVREEVPPGGAWLRSSTCTTRALGDSYGPIEVSRAEGES
ncbi:MAG: NADH-quinone oxidoreductase subunit NuoG [Xanthomonadales bacterium]|nr:NADH-quinone oxidoreductase subunit NuoG [Xanthomonadales bacterium]